MSTLAVKGWGPAGEGIGMVVWWRCGMKKGGSRVGEGDKEYGRERGPVRLRVSSCIIHVETQFFFHKDVLLLQNRLRGF